MKFVYVWISRQATEASEHGSEVDSGEDDAATSGFGKAQFCILSGTVPTMAMRVFTNHFTTYIGIKGQ